MRIAAASTPAIDAVFDALGKQRTAESGMLVSFERVAPDAPGAQFRIADELPMLATAEGDGILVISAYALLAPGSALHRMLRLAELDARHLALFATRSWRSDEHALVSLKRIQAYTMVEISREGLSEMTDAVMSYVRTWERFHLVLDISAADPAFAPGLVAPVPGGLTGRELIYVAQRLRLIRTLASVTMLLDAAPESQTSALAAHLITELA